MGAKSVKTARLVSGRP